MKTSYELLLHKYSKKKIEIKECTLPYEYKGLYKNNQILIEKSLSTNEKVCILTEEVGHHYTTVGDITAQAVLTDIKQENTARRWAYPILVPVDSIIEAKNYGCTSRYEIAEFIGVTEEFLQDSIQFYFNKYGKQIEYQGKIITFEPLNVFEK